MIQPRLYPFFLYGYNAMRMAAPGILLKQETIAQSVADEVVARVRPNLQRMETGQNGQWLELVGQALAVLAIQTQPPGHVVLVRYFWSTEGKSARPLLSFIGILLSVPDYLDLCDGDPFVLFRSGQLDVVPEPDWDARFRDGFIELERPEKEDFVLPDFRAVPGTLDTVARIFTGWLAGSSGAALPPLQVVPAGNAGPRDLLTSGAAEAVFAALPPKFRPFLSFSMLEGERPEAFPLLVTPFSPSLGDLPHRRIALGTPPTSGENEAARDWLPWLQELAGRLSRASGKPLTAQSSLDVPFPANVPPDDPAKPASWFLSPETLRWLARDWYADGWEQRLRTVSGDVRDADLSAALAELRVDLIPPNRREQVRKTILELLAAAKSVVTALPAIESGLRLGISTEMRSVLDHRFEQNPELVYDWCPKLTERVPEFYRTLTLVPDAVDGAARWLVALCARYPAEKATSARGGNDGFAKAINRMFSVTRIEDSAGLWKKLLEGRSFRDAVTVVVLALADSLIDLEPAFAVLQEMIRSKTLVLDDLVLAFDQLLPTTSSAGSSPVARPPSDVAPAGTTKTPDGRSREGVVERLRQNIRNEIENRLAYDIANFQKTITGDQARVFAGRLCRFWRADLREWVEQNPELTGEVILTEPARLEIPVASKGAFLDELQRKWSDESVCKRIMDYLSQHGRRDGSPHGSDIATWCEEEIAEAKQKVEYRQGVGALSKKMDEELKAQTASRNKLREEFQAEIKRIEQSEHERIAGIELRLKAQWDAREKELERKIGALKRTLDDKLRSDDNLPPVIGVFTEKGAQAMQMAGVRTHSREGKKNQPSYPNAQLVVNSETQLPLADTSLATPDAWSLKALNNQMVDIERRLTTLQDQILALSARVPEAAIVPPPTPPPQPPEPPIPAALSSKSNRAATRGPKYGADVPPNNPSGGRIRRFFNSVPKWLRWLLGAVIVAVITAAVCLLGLFFPRGPR